MSVKTIQGGVQTVTITPTAPPAAAQTTDGSNEIHPTNKGGFWSDTGKVAGVFVVVGLLIAAMIGAIIFFLLRRRNSQNKATTITSVDDDPPNSGSGAPYMVDRRRSNLTLATTGLAGLTRGSSHDKSPNEKTPGSLSRRGSIPMGPHDQRLNPAALYNAHPNGSHASIASFRDDQDYSRPVLHVRNPDSE
jgi:LPXTG-motif cell wall-anchored protein